MLYYLLATIYVLVCGMLLLVILLQQGKGGDISSAFGGGSSQTAFGARAGATVLSRATAICAALFMIGAVALAIAGRRGPASVVGGTPAPRPPATAPATPTSAPATPAGAPAQAPSSSAPASGTPAAGAPAATTSSPPQPPTPGK
jgi:preprotein translocase subunit SecG